MQKMKNPRRPALFSRRWKRKAGRVATYALALLIGVSAGQAIGDALIKPEPTPAAVETAPQEYIFRDVDGCPVDVQDLSSTWADATGLTKRYPITDAERWEIASVLTAEAIGEPFAGKVAVAQCILQYCEDHDMRPLEAIVAAGYAKSRPEPTAEALEAVQAVFDFGQVASLEPIKYFYAPARCESTWHETQDYVMTIEGHRFFKEVQE